MKCGKFWNFFYSVQNWNKKRKVNKIDFYKFNWVFWKKNEYIFLGYFSSSRYEEKKIKNF